MTAPRKITEGDRSVDIAVIGGGVFGASAALRLADAGHSVTLFEAKTLGAGATGAAAGMLCPDVEGCSPGASAEVHRVLKAAAAMWPKWAARLGVPLEADGSLWLTPAVPALGPVEDLSADLPDLAASGLVPMGYRFPDDRRLDPAVLIGQLRHHMAQQGVTLREHTPIEAVEATASQAQIVVYETRHRFDYVLVATGHRVPPGVRLQDGWQDQLMPIRGQGVLMKAPAPDHILRGQGVYVCPVAAEVCYVGATMEVGVAEPVSAPEALRPLMEKAAKTLWPQLMRAAILDYKVGIRPGSKDHLPKIGPTKDPTVWAILGGHRNGILLSPWVADHLVSQMTTAEAATSA